MDLSGGREGDQVLSLYSHISLALLLKNTKLPSAVRWWPWLTDQVVTPEKNFVASFGLAPPNCQTSCPVRVILM